MAASTAIRPTKPRAVRILLGQRKSEWKCQEKVDRINKEIQAYNDFVHKCRDLSRRNGGGSGPSQGGNSGSGSSAGRGAGAQQRGGGLPTEGRDSRVHDIHCTDQSLACNSSCEKLRALATANKHNIPVWSAYLSRYHDCWTGCSSREDACLGPDWKQRAVHCWLRAEFKNFASKSTG
jgi:hypothetical protein